MKIYKKDIDKVVEILLNAKSELINDNDFYEFKNQKLNINSHDLPEKQCVKNIDTLEPGKFFNKILNTNVYIDNTHRRAYLHNHDISNVYYKNFGFQPAISDNYIREGFTEISLVQFLKYVLNENK